MLDKLSQRERLMLIGLLGVGLLGLVFFGGRKVMELRQKISKDVISARERVVKMEKLKNDILSLPSAKSFPDKDNFLAQATSLMTKHGLKATNRRSRVDTSRTEEIIIVELAFTGTPLQPVIKFLHDVEYGKVVNAQVGGLVFRKPLPKREIYDVKVSLMIRKPKEKKASKTK